MSKQTTAAPSYFLSFFNSASSTAVAVVEGAIFVVLELFQIICVSKKT